MKTLKNSLFVILFATITSCSKSDAPAPVLPVIYKEEATPVSFLEQEIALITGIENVFLPSGGYYDTGFEFNSKVKGKINSISVSIKTAIPNLEVTIWDETTKLLIGSATFSSLANTKVSVKLTEPVLIEKNKPYIILLKVDINKIISTQKTDKSDLGIFPYTSNGGNILIQNAASRLFPAGPQGVFEFLSKQKNIWYKSSLDFKFQQTE